MTVLKATHTKCGCGGIASRKCRSCGKARCTGCMDEYQCIHCVAARRRKVFLGLKERTKKIRVKLWDLQSRWRDFSYDTRWDSMHRDPADEAVNSLERGINEIGKILEEKDEQFVTTK